MLQGMLQKSGMIDGVASDWLADRSDPEIYN